MALAGPRWLLGQSPAVVEDELGRSGITNLSSTDFAYVEVWRVAGPFKASAQQGALANRDKDLGRLLDRSIGALEAQLVGGGSLGDGAEWHGIEGATGVVNLGRVVRPAPGQSTFAITEVSSPVETYAALMANADDGIRVWVNGELATTKSEHEELKFHYRFARVHLKQGTNLIVAKLVYMGPPEKKGRVHWRFAVALTSLETARREKAAHTVLNGITTPLIAKDAELGLDLTLFEKERPVTVEIFNRDHEPLKTFQLEGGKRQSPVLTDLPDGLYYNRLYHGPMQQIDDLLPTTLVWYVSPCEASEAYGALAKVYPGNKGYALKSHACEEIPDVHRF